MTTLIKKSHPVKVILLCLLGVGIIAFIGYGLTANNWSFFLPRRLKQLAAMLIVSICIGYSSIAFQTITHNHILTPSVMGLDSLYLFIQTLVLFSLGSHELVMLNDVLFYLISVLIMVTASFGLYYFMFNGEDRNVYILVLVGMVLGSFFGGLSSFIQMLIDPNEFGVLQGRMFASFDAVNIDLVWISLLLMVVALLLGFRNVSQFDVLELGKDHAINLGIDYNRFVQKTMLSIAILVAISTALVGPITFLGIIIASISRYLLNTIDHRQMMPIAVLLTSNIILWGQFLLTRVLDTSTTLPVVVNFFGGIFFILILLKETKS